MILGILPERARHRHTVGKRPLDRVAEQNPAALGARNGPADHDETALGIGLDHTQVLRGDADVAHVAGHLLALEDLAGLLALTGRTMTSVVDRHAMAGPKTAKAVTLHATGETLTDRGARDVHELPLDEVVGGDLRAHIDHVLGAHAELGDPPLGLNIGHGEATALGTRQTLHFRAAGTELNGRVAVLLRGPLTDDLTVLQTQHRHGNVLPAVGEDPGHADLLRDNT
ncbi:MAG: hypothetical protein A49_22280 [Methyloceanibacter sp.]|nr:MAG: hypothetical protein A49_22280 [Methyloceanibacter sp.]